MSTLLNDICDAMIEALLQFFGHTSECCDWHGHEKWPKNGLLLQFFEARFSEVKQLKPLEPKG